MASNWMIYGAYGYTGRLTTEAAVRQGLRPTLAGRDRDKVKALAESHGLPWTCFSLDDEPAKFGAALQDQALVLHCAGPFSKTSRPMIEACLETGTHYLDITGEISVFDWAWQQDQRAREADVLLCPGVGFDVVPTDCLAAKLVARLPAATSLILAFEAGGGPSRGTARTSIEGMGQGGRIRQDGQLRTVPLAWKSRTVPFAHGERSVVTIPWGDVFTAWVSTGVPNVAVYMAMPPAAIRKMKRLAVLGPALSWGWVQRLLLRQVDKRVSGPDEERRASTGSEVWGEVRSADGRRVSGTLSGPNGYDITVSASLGVVSHVLSGDVESGYATPSLLMGADFAATLPGVTLSLGEPVSD